MVVTAGPTREPIDPVRFISNYSTGYMGALLAAEALRRGHRVTVICGPVTEPMPRGARVVPVEQAREMEQALRRAARGADAVIMAAAVADYRMARPAPGKLKRAGRLTLRLQATPDVIGRLPRRRGQVVAGFALETDRAVFRARAKLRRKRLDLILAQQAARTRGLFGRQAVRAWLVDRRGGAVPLGTVPKARVARVLLDKIEALWYRQRGHGASS